MSHRSTGDTPVENDRLIKCKRGNLIFDTDFLIIFFVKISLLQITKTVLYCVWSWKDPSLDDRLIKCRRRTLIFDTDFLIIFFVKTSLLQITKTVLHCVWYWHQSDVGSTHVMSMFQCTVLVFTSIIRDSMHLYYTDHMIITYDKILPLITNNILIPKEKNTIEIWEGSIENMELLDSLNHIQ